MPSADRRRGQRVSTFLFADLAGFTALTEAHGDERAADLVDEFAAAADELLPRFGAEQIKAIGDALMIRVPDAGAAVRLGCELTGELLAEHGYPAVRVGMHHGPAVERSGDWFGATVNLAARISGLAAGGEVLLSAATREAAGEVAGVRFLKRGEQRLRNVSGPVHLYAAVPRRAAGRGTVTDPVCRMALDPDRTAGSLRYEGRDYQFCSLECAARFAAAPSEYAHDEQTPRRGYSDCACQVPSRSGGVCPRAWLSATPCARCGASSSQRARPYAGATAAITILADLAAVTAPGLAPWPLSPGRSRVRSRRGQCREHRQQRRRGLGYSVRPGDDRGDARTPSSRQRTHLGASAAQPARPPAGVGKV